MKPQFLERGLLQTPDGFRLFVRSLLRWGALASVVALIGGGCYGWSLITPPSDAEVAKHWRAQRGLFEKCRDRLLELCPEDGSIGVWSGAVWGPDGFSLSAAEEVELRALLARLSVSAVSCSRRGGVRAASFFVYVDREDTKSLEWRSDPVPSPGELVRHTVIEEGWFVSASW